MARAINHANSAKTHCKHGHEFTPENTRLKMRNGSTRRECRACDRERAARTRIEQYERHREKILASHAAYAQTERGREIMRRAAERWAQRNPEKRIAHTAVMRAVAAGTLVRQPCEQLGATCDGEIHAHHDDYSQPLEVRWLCRRHHTQHHNALRRSAS